MNIRTAWIDYFLAFFSVICGNLEVPVLTGDFISKVNLSCGRFEPKFSRVMMMIIIMNRGGRRHTHRS